MQRDFAKSETKGAVVRPFFFLWAAFCMRQIEFRKDRLFRKGGLSRRRRGLYRSRSLIVDIDTEGNNFFDELDEKIAERKAEALNDLGIDPSFAFTKLY